MLALSDLPAVNASLNATSALLLAAGYVFILKGHVDAHRRCMLAALTTSALFLISYLIYHYNVGSVPFTGRGWIRVVYFYNLKTHTVLVTVARALRADFIRHRRIARWTLPLWFYVSVTGVVVYWMLYRL